MEIWRALLFTKLEESKLVHLPATEPTAPKPTEPG